MKSAGSLALIMIALAVALPRAAQEKIERPILFHIRDSGTPERSLAQVVTSEVVPLTAADSIGAVHAQVTASDAWSNVTRLAPGEEVRLTLGNATSYRGSFRLADDQSFTLVVAGHDRRMSRASIRRVSVARGSHRRRHVLIGLAIGAATGGVALALHCRGEAPSCKEWGPAYIPPGAGVGAAIGSLLPARTWQEIYNAAPARP